MSIEWNFINIVTFLYNFFEGSEVLYTRSTLYTIYNKWMVNFTIRRNISMSDELYEKIKHYNENHPYAKLNISKVSQDAIEDKIKELTA